MKKTKKQEEMSEYWISTKDNLPPFGSLVTVKCYNDAIIPITGFIGIGEISWVITNPTHYHILTKDELLNLNIANK